MDKFDDNGSLRDEVKKSLESDQNIIKDIQNIRDDQKKIVELARPFKDILPIHSGFTTNINFQNPAIEVLKTANFTLKSILDTPPIIKTPTLTTMSLGLSSLEVPTFHIDTSTLKIAKSLIPVLPNPFLTSVQNVLNTFSSTLIATIESPFVKWLNSVDFAPLTHILEGCTFEPTLLEEYGALNEIYLKAMYSAKWFPYAGWIADLELFAEINDILDTSRGMSKRCEKRIDKAIISYYNKSEINYIKKQWKSSELEPHTKKALCQTLEAYLRKEYALVIPLLATMWEGIIKSKIEENTKKPKDDFKKLVDKNGYDEVFSDFYNNMILATCYSVEDVVEGIPNRNGIAHSWYPKYPSQKAALNAILLTDFIIKLKPTKKDAV